MSGKNGAKPRPLASLRMVCSIYSCMQGFWGYDRGVWLSSEEKRWVGGVGAA